MSNTMRQRAKEMFDCPCQAATPLDWPELIAQFEEDEAACALLREERRKVQAETLRWAANSQWITKGDKVVLTAWAKEIESGEIVVNKEREG